MVKWQGRERSSNIEDRRGQGGGFGGGLGGGSNPFGQGSGGGFRVPMGRTGGSFGTIAIVVIVLIIYVMAGGQLDSLFGGEGGGSFTQNLPPSTADTDTLAEYVGVVTRDTETFWGKYFADRGETYQEPTVVLFTGQTNSGCGTADAASGPFYCPNDGKVYIDLTFYEQMRTQLGAPGDFAQAYVIAHEIGHHVQDLLGTLDAFNQQRQTMSEDAANAYSVKVELQADCYAGFWARGEQAQQFLEDGDVEEAINAANQIGDDRLTGGRIPPSQYTHGTSKQRMEWFQRGFNATDIAQCDTFSGAV